MAGQKAIIHTATRVIRRLTTDAAPDIAADETAVDMGAVTLDLAGGYWKLDAQNNRVPATQADIDAADVDPVREAAIRAQFMQNYLASVDAIAAASTAGQMLTALQAWAPRHRKLILGLIR